MIFAHHMPVAEMRPFHKALAHLESATATGLGLVKIVISSFMNQWYYQ
jgi:hypothetical protein